jgi:hypothetical protein
MNRDDVRVAKRCRCACLAEEPGPDDLVGGERWRERLDRDESLELEVAREEHDAHATAPHLADDLVLAGQGLRKREGVSWDSHSGRRASGGWRWGGH